MQGQTDKDQEITVFVSYAREDSDAARRLYEDLKNAGVIPWLDKESLIAGQNWKIAINEAIKKSRYFIPIFSSISVAKRGYVQKEFKYALDVFDEFPESQIFVIPVRLDQCKIPYEKLKDIEYVDLFPDWNEGLEKIIQAITYKQPMGDKKQYQNEKEASPSQEITSDVMLGTRKGARLFHFKDKAKHLSKRGKLIILVLGISVIFAVIFFANEYNISLARPIIIIDSVHGKDTVLFLRGFVRAHNDAFISLLKVKWGDETVNSTHILNYRGEFRLNHNYTAFAVYPIEIDATDNLGNTNTLTIPIRVENGDYFYDRSNLTKVRSS